MDEHWPIFSGWARRVIDHPLPTAAQEAAVHGPQHGSTNQGSYPMPAAAFPCPPPPAHYAD